MNGGWIDPAKELPGKDILVLAVKQLKNGTMDYCLARCNPNYRYYDTEKKELVDGPYWTCGGNNNIILWMPLPEITKAGKRTQQETDFHDCVNELCQECGKYHREHEGACDGCRWLKPRRGW